MFAASASHLIPAACEGRRAMSENVLFADVSDRLKKLENRLAGLKTGNAPNDAEAPAPGGAEEPLLRWSKVRSDYFGIAGWDMCFKFPAPHYLESLKKDCEESGIDEATKTSRQQAYDQAVKQEEADNEFFTDYVKNRVHVKGDGTESRRRLPQTKGKMAGHERVDMDTSDALEALFRDFLVEERDRLNLQIPQNLRNIADARKAAICMMMSFFCNKQDYYETFMYVSQDKDELFLCVRMLDEAACAHAEVSHDLHEVRNESLRDLGVIIDDKELRPYFKFSRYLQSVGIFKKFPMENDPSRSSQFRKMDRVRLLYDSLTDVIDIDAMFHWRLLSGFFPVHTTARLKEYQDSWGHLKNGFRTWWINPPVDEIEHYFGSQIAMYFVFCGVLCHSLCVLVLASCTILAYVAVKAGSCTEAINGFLNGAKHSDARGIFAVIIIMWTLYLEYQMKKAEQRNLALWGLGRYFGKSDVKFRQSSRFLGHMMVSEVDASKVELGVSSKELAIGRQKSKICTGIFSVFVVMIITSIYLGAAWASRRGYASAFGVAGYIVTITIKILAAVWDSVAKKFTDWEYHRYEQFYLESWATKTVIISSISAFIGFVYVGFVMDHVDHCPDTHVDCFGYLCYEMAIIFTIYIVFAAWDIFYPIVDIQIKLLQEKRAMQQAGKEVSAISFLELQSKWEEYTSADQAEDYCQHMIPLAFVLLFGMTLPISPLLALANSVAQTHADAYKITHTTQRPYPSRSLGGLQLWIDMVETFTWLAVYSNVGLISFDLEPFKSMSVHKQLLAFFGLSTFVHCARGVFRHLMPVQDASHDLMVARQERIKEVLNVVEHEHSKGLVNPKDESEKTAWSSLTPQDLLSNSEAEIAPLELQASTSNVLPNGINMTSVTGLDRSSENFDEPPGSLLWIEAAGSLQTPVARKR